MRTKNNKSKMLVKALAFCATLCTAFGVGYTVVNHYNAPIVAGAEETTEKVDYTDYLGLEDRAWASDSANVITLGLMDFSVTEVNKYFKSSVSGCWYQGNNDVIAANNGFDILQYIYVNGECARDLLIANTAVNQTEAGTTTWLSNPVAWPVAIETGADVWLRFSKTKFTDTFTIAFKKGFQLIRNDGVNTYLSQDVIYEYNKGVLTRLQQHTISFEGTDVSKTLLAGEKVGEMPAVPAQEGKVGLWSLNGKILNEDDILTSSGVATPIYATEYKDLLGLEDRAWGAHEGEYYFGGVTLSPFGYFNSAAGVCGTWYVGNDAPITANNGVDIMEYIYVNDKSARELITTNANGAKLTNSCNCWLSNPAASPVYVETTAGDGILIRILKAYAGESFTLTFKKGFSLIRNDGEVIYLSEDVNYKYENGTLAKAFALTFEGSDEVKMIANGAAIGELPVISTEEGVHAEWQIDGEAITAETPFSFTSNKTATIAYYANVTVNGETKRMDLGAKLEKPADPIVEDTESHTYTFEGWFIKGTETKWDFDTNVVERDVELEAKITETEKAKYSVTFNPDNGTENGVCSVYVGATLKAEQIPANPEKEQTADFVYEFKFWSADGETAYDFTAPVTGDVELTAVYQAKGIFTVSFDGDNGASYPVATVIEGDTVAAPQEIPTKESDGEEVTYTFLFWSVDGETAYDFSAPVTQSFTLTAVYSTKKVYEVTIGGASYNFEDGSLITAVIADPTKEETESHTYTFDGWYLGETKWNFAEDVVTGDMELVAKFIETEKAKFDVTFNADNGTNSVVESVYVGATLKAEQIPANPEKAATAEYTYTFVGWYNGETEYDFEAPVTEAITLTAKYTATKNVYVVTFTAEGVSNTADVEYGSVATAPAAPTKAATAEYTYTFDGWYLGETKWNFAEDVVTGNVELVAKFTAGKNKYTISFNVTGNDDVTLAPVAGVEYGTTYDLSNILEGKDVSRYTYTVTVNGEAATSVVVNGNVTVDVTFTARVYFNVTIDGVSQEVEQGGKLTAPATTPTKDATAEYTYTFAGWYNGETKWDFENDVVNGNVNLVAKFTETKRTYTVTFNVVGNDAITLDPVTVEYGATLDLSTLLDGKDVSAYTYAITVNGVEKISVKVVGDTTVEIAFTKKADNSSDDKDSGCGSVVSGAMGALAGVTALGVALFVSKKKED